MKIWYQQITEASSWEALLEIARSYLSSLTPHEWISVPAACRPDRIKGIDDLAHWQQCLAHAYLEVAATDKASEIHRDMLAFFTSAADRASELVGRACGPAEEATNDGAAADVLRSGNGA